MSRPSRILLAVGFLAVVAASDAQAQLPDQLQHWLQPLQNCRSISCILRNIPTGPVPRRPWVPLPIGNGGPITTTPEPLTMALLGTGLAGIGLAARRRRQEELQG